MTDPDIDSMIGMDEYQQIQFKAETMRIFKDSDAGKIVRSAILGLIQYHTARLLDRKRTKEEPLAAITAEIRALNDILNAIEEPEREKQYWDNALQQKKENDRLENYVVSEEVVEYRGSEAVL